MYELYHSIVPAFVNQFWNYGLILYQEYDQAHTSWDDFEATPLPAGVFKHVRLSTRYGIICWHHSYLWERLRRPTSVVLIVALRTAVTIAVVKELFVKQKDHNDKIMIIITTRQCHGGDMRRANMLKSYMTENQ